MSLGPMFHGAKRTRGAFALETQLAMEYMMMIAKGMDEAARHALYEVEMKPKNELIPRAKLFTKTRNIFSPNTFA